MNMYNGGFGGSNFGQPQKTEEPEPLSNEKIEEFKSFVEMLDKKIESNYGKVRSQERINVERFNNLITTIDKCIGEGTLVITENRSRKYINIKKVRFNYEPNGEEALSSLKVELNGKLKVPWIRRVNLFDFPFQISTRELSDKKCVEMLHTFPQSKYTATIRMIIREI
ncbi:MAG: hypothetical protein CVV24_01790 [Ignavibacteriae bacterium HGW-Ignavibacteriae-3]|nr:MAG: hypothetical protein CVV24_01790 [Ignavibacteriae bacterium HGW-Ignavibacteriae-3]